MTSQLLGRTHHSEVESLAVSGLPIHEMLQQIRLELRKSVGDEHALLFAEPNANPETGHIQWYASTEGTARRLNELVGEERQAADARLARLTTEILAHASRLRESSDPQDQQVAKALGDALEIPREADIFMVGRQPVIAAWGHVRRGADAERQILQTMAQRVRQPEAPPPAPALPPAPPPPRPRPPVIQSPAPPAAPPAAVLASVPAVAEHERSWLGPFLWLVLVLLLLLIGYLMLRNCAVGVAGSVLLDFCPAPQAQEDLLRRQMLERRLADLQRQLEQRRNSCVAPPATPPPQQSPVPPRKGDSQPAPTPDPRERVQRAGGRIGYVNIVVTWQSQDNLAVVVTCPDGEAHYAPTCHGTMDLGPASRTNVGPLVNIVWGENAPRGRYRLSIWRHGRDAATTPFTVQLLINGDVASTASGNADSTPGVTAYFTFELPDGVLHPQPPRKP